MRKWNAYGTRIQELRVFQAILQSRNITQAAELMGLTQSSVSKQLKALREAFDDALFVRTAEGMEATSRALQIAEHVNRILEEFDALQGDAHFDPKALTGEQVISTTDEVQERLISPLLKAVSAEAPDLRLTFRPLQPDYALKQLESGSVSLLITVNWHAPEQLKQKRLYQDSFVVAMRKSHPLNQEELTLQRYLSVPHLLVAPLGMTMGIVDRLLQEMGCQRKVQLSVPNFRQAGDILRSSDMIATLPATVVDKVSDGEEIVTKEVPLTVPIINYYCLWHKRYDNDGINRWLRHMVFDILG